MASRLITRHDLRLTHRPLRILHASPLEHARASCLWTQPAAAQLSSQRLRASKYGKCISIRKPSFSTWSIRLSKSEDANKYHTKPIPSTSVRKQEVGSHLISYIITSMLSVQDIPESDRIWMHQAFISFSMDITLFRLGVDLNSILARSRVSLSVLCCASVFSLFTVTPVHHIITLLLATTIPRVSYILRRMLTILEPLTTRARYAKFNHQSETLRPPRTSLEHPKSTHLLKATRNPRPRLSHCQQPPPLRFRPLRLRRHLRPPRRLDRTKMEPPNRRWQRSRPHGR